MTAPNITQTTSAGLGRLIGRRIRHFVEALELITTGQPARRVIGLHRWRLRPEGPGGTGPPPCWSWLSGRLQAIQVVSLAGEWFVVLASVSAAGQWTSLYRG